jgi:two-component system LytT family response regulator
VSARSRLRALVVDDEEPARRLLAEYLARLPDWELAGECANGFEAVRAAAQLRPDLVLLDVQMPKLDGFEVLDLLGEDAPAVIFVTAHDEHALRAFAVHAVDYLLKPVAPERFAQALDRAAARLRSGERPPARALLESSRPQGRFLERIAVREAEGRVEVVAVDGLDFVEAHDDYVRLATGGKKLVKQMTLQQLEAQLDPRRFVRIHRSFLLNIERLARIDLYAKDSRAALLRDGTKLPVSRAGYERLRTLL